MPLLEELKPRTSYRNLASVIADLSTRSKITEEDLVGFGAVELRREASASVRAFPIYRYMSVLERTEVFLEEYADALVEVQGEMGLNTDCPRYATELVLEEVRELRQVADAHGISYGFFCQRAIRFWVGREHRMPRMRDLLETDVIDWVVRQWDRPELRHAEILYPQEWDMRFRAECYVGDGPQEALQQLLIDRIKFYRNSGCDAMRELRQYVGTCLPYGKAVRELDVTLVEDAFARAPLEQGVEEFLANL